MAITSIAGGHGFELERGAALVCIPLAADDTAQASEQALATTESVVEHTDSAVAVLIVGSPARIASMEGALPSHLRERTMLGLATEPDTSQAQALQAAAQASSPSDLVLVAPGIRVTAHWLESLRAAASSDSTVASSTPFSLGGGAVQLFEDGQERRFEDPVEELARRVAEHSLCLRPRVATSGPACAYIRRAALELAGPFDEELPLDEALAGHARRAIAAGLVHVVADDVLVQGASGSPAVREEQVTKLVPGNELGVQQTLLNDEHGSLRRAIGVARMALRRLSVTIDGRALTATVGGTQTYIIELVVALTRGQRVAVRVLIPPDLSERAAAAFSSLAGLELLTYEQAIDEPPRSDVVHRPQSVFTADDLTLLRLLGERVVIGQLDLIAYHNYSYHQDIEHWRAYRRATRLALGGADQVIFFSGHARRDALTEDLLPSARTHVVGVGAEAIEHTRPPETSPEGFTEHDPFLLCLGADYAHKNRPFAIELLAALRERGWGGRLVLAGGHVAFGSSSERERELLAHSADLAPFVVDLGSVDEASKSWLYRHARALVYPTIYEGFGLLPLEAARADLPCLFAAQASLSELAGAAATLIAWDARASAAAVLPLLSDGPAREQHLARLHALAIPSWSEVSEQLVAVYKQAVTAPPSEAASRIWQELDRENFIGRLETTAQEYQDAYHQLEARVGPGLPLIDEGGLLSRSQQRGLMRIAARGRLGTLVLSPLRLLGRSAAAEGSGDSPASES
jgi:glycosyltransferase involved in cell wall biosynthesis